MMDKITIEEARKIATRFIDSYFNNLGGKPRICIPAEPEYDDDLRLMAFIDQHAALLAEAERLREESARSYALGAREGWLRCGVHHVNLDFEGFAKTQEEIDTRWPIEASPPPAPRQATGEEAARE